MRRNNDTGKWQVWQPGVAPDVTWVNQSEEPQEVIQNSSLEEATIEPTPFVRVPATRPAYTTLLGSTFPFKVLGVWDSGVYQAGDRPSTLVSGFTDILGFANQGKQRNDYALIGATSATDYAIRNGSTQRPLNFTTSQLQEDFESFADYYNDDYYGVVPTSAPDYDNVSQTIFYNNYTNTPYGSIRDFESVFESADGNYFSRRKIDTETDSRVNIINRPLDEVIQEGVGGNPALWFNRQEATLSEDIESVETLDESEQRAVVHGKLDAIQREVYTRTRNIRDTTIKSSGGSWKYANLQTPDFVGPPDAALLEPSEFTSSYYKNWSQTRTETGGYSKSVQFALTDACSLTWSIEETTDGLLTDTTAIPSTGTPVFGDFTRLGSGSGQFVWGYNFYMSYEYSQDYSNRYDFSSAYNNRVNTFVKGAGNLAYVELESREVINNSLTTMTAAAEARYVSTRETLLGTKTEVVESVRKDSRTTSYKMANEATLEPISDVGSFYFRIGPNILDLVDPTGPLNFPVSFQVSDSENIYQSKFANRAIDFPLKVRSVTTRTFSFSTNQWSTPSVTREALESVTDEYSVEPNTPVPIELIVFKEGLIYKFVGTAAIAYASVNQSNFGVQYALEYPDVISVVLTSVSTAKYHALLGSDSDNFGHLYSTSNCLGLLQKIGFGTRTTLYKWGNVPAFSFADSSNLSDRANRYADVYALIDGKFVRKGSKSGSYAPLVNPATTDSPENFFIGYYGPI